MKCSAGVGILLFVIICLGQCEKQTTSVDPLFQKLQGVWDETPLRPEWLSREFSWGNGKYSMASVIFDAENGKYYLLAPGGRFNITAIDELSTGVIRIVVEFYNPKKHYQGYIDITPIQGQGIWFESHVNYAAWFLRTGKNHVYFKISPTVVPTP